MNEDAYQNDTDEDFISKSQLKREALQHLDLGREIVALQPKNLEKIPLDDDLRSAIDEARAITSNGARKRQLQYIAKILRNRDVSAIRAALDQIKEQSSSSNAAFRQCERWRERLLNEGSSALEDFITAFPAVDRQQLRQMIRNAQKEVNANKPPKVTRLLFQLIRELLLEE
jgi:ribosome-associated protein